MPNPSDLQLIDQIYEAVQTPDLLMPAYQAVAEQCGGFAAHYLSVERQQSSIFESQVSDENLSSAQSAYADYYISIDPRLPWYSGGGVGEWRVDQQIFDECYIQRSEIYNDFLKPAGSKRLALCQLRKTAQDFTSLSILRPHDAGDFLETELRHLQLFSSHLVRATELRMRLKQANLALHSAQGALEYLPYGTVWLNASGRIVWISPSAESQLAAADGLSIRATRLCCTHPQLDRQLHTALQRATHAAGREGSWFHIPRRGQATPWLLSILPGVLPESGNEVPHVLVIIQDGNGPPLPQALQLRQLYGLTPAEARLALGLLNHDTLAEYAANQHLSLPTVKTHLRNLFTKTGTSRQAELLHRIALPVSASRAFTTSTASP